MRQMRGSHRLGSWIKQPAPLGEGVGAAAAGMAIAWVMAAHAPVLAHAWIAAWIVHGLAVQRFLAYGLAGSYFVFLCMDPGRRQYLSVIGFGVAADVVLKVFGAAPGHFMPASMFGAGSIAIVTAGVTTRRGAWLNRDFVALVVIPICAFLSSVGLQFTLLVHGRDYDLLLYRFDATLGFEPSAQMHRILGGIGGALPACDIVYCAVPFFVSVLYGLQRSGRIRLPVNLLLELGAATAAGFAIYFIFPAAGPWYLLSSRLSASPAPALVPSHLAVAHAYMNAMPSLHITWMLLLWWACTLAPWPYRACTFAALLLTVIATLALGEHYLADVVVAFPFALALQAMAMRGVPAPIRNRSALIGAGLTAAWLVLLRFGVGELRRLDGFSYLLIAATLAICAHQIGILFGATRELYDALGPIGTPPRIVPYPLPAAAAERSRDAWL
jgi:hypothetical protein